MLTNLKVIDQVRNKITQQIDQQASYQVWSDVWHLLPDPIWYHVWEPVRFSVLDEIIQALPQEPM